jgi:hypothetical protein
MLGGNISVESEFEKGINFSDEPENFSPYILDVLLSAYCLPVISANRAPEISRASI